MRATGHETFHVVLMDNARTDVLADKEGRQTLNCIRCGACQNACPVYRQTGGHAYGSVYAGPIGAILTPQLQQMHHAQSLPYASSLCGACYEVCPVKINIPEVLIHLRNKVVVRKGLSTESLAMKAMAAIFRSERRFRAAPATGAVSPKLRYPVRTAGRRLDRLAARSAGRMDAGERPQGDAKGDLSRLVGGRGETVATNMDTVVNSSAARADILRRIREANGRAAGAPQVEQQRSGIERSLPSFGDSLAFGSDWAAARAAARLRCERSSGRGG